MLPGREDLDWLVGATAPPPGRLASRLDLAGAAALAVGFWQVIGHTAPRIRAASAWPEAEELDLLDAIAHAVALHVGLQERLLGRLGAALDDAAVPYVVLKGCALRRTAYAHPEHRGSWDIDLGVARRDLARTEAIVRALGFSPAIRERPSGRFIPAPVVFRAILEAHHYELCTMVREALVPDLDARDLAAVADTRETLGNLLWDVRGGAWIARTAIDVHHGLDDHLPIEPVLATARRVGGLAVPAEGWLVVHAARTLWREIRREGARVLHHLGDLARLLPSEPAAAARLADGLPDVDLPPIPTLRAAMRQGPLGPQDLLLLCTPGELASPRAAAGV